MQAIGELVIDPATPATLYAATALGVFKTTNEAETWNPTDLVQHSLLSSVSLDPSSVIGGATSTGTVRLAIPAPVEGTVVALSTTVAGVTIPPSIVVPGGATSVTFGISTIAVTTLTTVVVSATSGDATRSASLSTYQPITIRHVSLRSFLTGGYSDTGSVMVTDGPLPPEGVTVSLASSNPAIASVPASVTIPAGTNYAFFTVSATAVATLTPVTITATFVTSASTAVTVTPAPTAVASISLPPSATGEYAYVSGEVSLNGAAPPGSMLMVRFSSSDASVARGSVDEAQVAWGEMGLRFSVITGLVSVPTAVTISASFNGTSKSTVLTVNPPFALTGVAVTPPSVVGTNAATGSVSLNAPAPAYGVDVAVLSSAPATASVPVSVTIPAGATTASFTISTSSVTMPTPVTISATYRGNTKFAVLTVNPVLPPDAIAPDTSIVSVVDGSGTPIAPGGATLSNAALIGFTGTDNVAIGGFECRLDGSGFTFCSTPFAAGPLAIGRHTFEVRAVDTSNNRDATPALYAWVVDSPPDTTITSATDKTGASVPNGGTIRSNAITFTFTGTDNSGVAGFECSLDGATFAACSSPTTYTSAGRGSHTFRVRAVDIGGFRDPTPSAFIWTR
jgi:hypothetical protein